MRTLLLLSLMLAGDVALRAQTPAAQTPRPAQPAPAQAPATPRPRAAQPANSRGGMAITVTSPAGAALEGVQVAILGATERSGTTTSSGQVNFPGLQAGTYRLRFSSEAVITFEKEVTLRAGQIADVDVTLNPAPPKPEAPPPAPAPAPAPTAAAGPAGQPLTLAIPDYLEKNFVGTQPRRETVLSCSGNTRTTMIQLNQPLPDRLYDAADAVYYVVAGEGSVRLAGKDTALTTNEYISVPRGTLHSFSRSGRRPLILLAVLSGEACEEAK